MQTNIQKSNFSKEKSFALKGIAIILMMLHHTFRSDTLYSDFHISFFPLGQQWVTRFASVAKICVPIFALISGYGLYLSYKNSTDKGIKWTIIRYIKTFSGYWFIWIASSIITQIASGRFEKVFGQENIWKQMLNIVIDFLGLANLYRTPTLNGTWWYMGAAFVFIVLTPFLLANEKNLCGCLLVEVIFLRVLCGKNSALAFPGSNTAFVYLFVFTLGMVFAKYKLVDRIINSGMKPLRFFVELLLLVLCFNLYINIETRLFWELKWGIIPVLLILFCVEFIIQIKFIGNILCFLGKHSMNIYMIHTFIRGVYFHSITYSMRHFGLVILFLLVSSLLCSIIVETIKKIIKYDVFISKLSDKLVGQLSSVADVGK